MDLIANNLFLIAAGLFGSSMLVKRCKHKFIRKLYNNKFIFKHVKKIYSTYIYKINNTVLLGNTNEINKPINYIGDLSFQRLKFLKGIDAIHYLDDIGVIYNTELKLNLLQYYDIWGIKGWQHIYMFEEHNKIHMHEDRKKLVDYIANMRYDRFINNLKYSSCFTAGLGCVKNVLNYINYI